jgi:hypothetical protein
MSTVSAFALAAALLTQAALVGANAFEAVVDVPNWRTPDGLKAYRAFTRARNPGAYYRVLSPATIVLLALGLATGWSGFAAADRLVAASLGATIVAEAATVAYFFPRNAALFFQPIEAEPGPKSRAIVDEWARANVARTAIVAAGWCALLLGAALVG